MQKNIKEHDFKIGKTERNAAKGHPSFLIWFTGLSGSGKSTIANAVEQELHQRGMHTYILDGDNIRHGLNSDLDFSPDSRTENIRRIGEVANLMVDAGLIVLAAFVSPYRKDRDLVAKTVGNGNYVEVYVSTSLEECERRDVKGLYEKARRGEIKNMTGISAPYEAPENPDIEVDHTYSLEDSVNKIITTIENRIKSYPHE
ncbi:adenylyl-sulfate kinase [Robertkochia marina]|uniref:Adenylyl-sulfate kinase n=1 Tax=Robertkochia marina TaxID=1227945 RepID=A0A4V3UY51_9FLAO|nr:adenylyl-sulfate kinase [Robertkochia marina]THD67746.1 adenylyl-sulfate kinase [Robertkochia marina]TRZ40959.1 adenylyl-sulfate kinase [Robertkochia marina]